MVQGEGSKGQPLLRLKSQPALIQRKFGLNYMTVDVAGMFFAALLVFVVTVLLRADITGIALGGFVGGWLIGNAANQVRFSSKIAEEQIEQGRIFYFSDPGVGPRTEISYLQVDPAKDKLVQVATETEKLAPKLNYPANKPVVTRRSARLNTANSNAKPKVEPLVRTAPNSASPIKSDKAVKSLDATSSQTIEPATRKSLERTDKKKH